MIQRGAARPGAPRATDRNRAPDCNAGDGRHAWQPVPVVVHPRAQTSGDPCSDRLTLVAIHIGHRDENIATSAVRSIADSSSARLPPPRSMNLDGRPNAIQVQQNTAVLP